MYQGKLNEIMLNKGYYLTTYDLRTICYEREVQEGIFKRIIFFEHPSTFEIEILKKEIYMHKVSITEPSIIKLLLDVYKELRNDYERLLDMGIKSNIKEENI